MTLNEVIIGLQYFFLLYFVGINGGYLVLNVLAAVNLSRYMRTKSTGDIPSVFSGFEPPISILVPAYNEQATIETSVRSLMQLEYEEYEIIVVNDGSEDETLGVLKRAFSLTLFPEDYQHRLPTKTIRKVYRSAVHPNLRVIDKENGGKADALNAGINYSRYDLFCAIDADSILQRDSLRRIVQPFLDDPSTVAGGGTVRIANGCTVSGGYILEAGLPRSILALFQIVEYLRAFLFGRLGWSSLNALLVISGAFGVFQKESVVAVGGYRADTVGEDMELVVRLHRHLRLDRKKYRIAFIPEPICWTEAPEDLKTLRNQRIRWHRGLSESLTKNWNLLFHPRSGMVGFLAFPFMVIFEWLGAAIEVVGYVFMVVGFALGIISMQAMVAFMLASIGLGILLSVCALFLEEVGFHIYPKFRQVFILILALLGENLGYRQLNSVWRVGGLIRWAFGAKGHWGEMKRKASWQKNS